MMMSILNSTSINNLPSAWCSHHKKSWLHPTNTDLTTSNSSSFKFPITVFIPGGFDFSWRMFNVLFLQLTSFAIMRWNKNEEMKIKVQFLNDSFDLGLLRLVSQTINLCICIPKTQVHLSQSTESLFHFSNDCKTNFSCNSLNNESVDAGKAEISVSHQSLVSCQPHAGAGVTPGLSLGGEDRTPVA